MTVGSGSSNSFSCALLGDSFSGVFEFSVALYACHFVALLLGGKSAAILRVTISAHGLTSRTSLN